MGISRTRYARPRLEWLEDRLAPASLTFIGGANNGDWGTASNWSPQQVPISTDTVVFNANSKNCTILPSDGHGNCAQLNNSSFTGVFAVQAPLTINGANGITLSTWDGGQIVQTGSTGTIDISGGVFRWTGGTWNSGGGATLNNVYLDGGVQFQMWGSASSFGSNIWVGYDNSTATLTVGSGGGGSTGLALTGNVAMTNDAAITIDSGSTLSFNQGSTSSGSVGGLTASANTQTITNYGSVIRYSPGNPAVTCGLGVGQTAGASLQVYGKLNITGQYGANGNSLQQNSDSAETLLANGATLGVTFGYYQTGGFLDTQTIGTAKSMATATINGTVQIYAGNVNPGYDGTSTLDNMATLNVNGSLIIGGSTEVGMSVDGSTAGWCDKISCSGQVAINPNPGDSATLLIDTWIQSPPSGQSYGLIWSEKGFVGHPFASITNVGYQATWNVVPPNPGYNPFTIKEQ